MLSLHTTVQKAGPAAAFVLTEADVDALGGGKRAAVVVTVGGRTARLRLASRAGVS